MAALDRAVERARAAQGGVVMLAGPPGIGKTCTAQQAADRAADAGMLVLCGRCPEEPGAPAYWPWLQALRHFVARHDEPAVHAAAGTAAAHLASLDPKLAARLPAHEPLAPMPDAAQARFALFDAIADFWQRVAARTPLLIVLDDLHCADVPSLKLLEFVARECASHALLLVGTYRDAEITRTHPLADTLGALARQTSMQRLRLGGFSTEETARFVESIGAAPALAAALHERTEGHPLFLAETARLLDETRGADALVALQRAPAGVRDVIGSRLNRLSPLCNHALGNAAVIGRRFSVDVLLALLDDPSEDQCLAVLDEAHRASLIEPLAEPTTWQFTHALIRDALYDEMPLPRRLRLHQRIAAIAEKLHGDEPNWLSALAHHYYVARSLAGCTAKAVEYATRAARHADATLAHEDTVRLYRLALQALEPALEVERLQLLLALGEAQIKAGDPAAIPELTEAAELARRLRATPELTRAALGYELASWHILGGSSTVAAALIREALALNSPLDNVLRARLLAALCRSLIHAGHVPTAVAIHAQAVAMARRLGDPETLLRALSAIVSARMNPELRPLRLAAGREALQLAEREGHREWALRDLAGPHIGELIEGGDLAGATHLADICTDAAALRHEPYKHVVLLSARAMLAQHAGRFDEAERFATAMQHGARFEELARGAIAVLMFTLRREQGRLAEVAPLLEHFRAAMPDSLTWQPGYIALCCELGRQEQAQEAFERLAAKNFVLSGHMDPGSLVYLAEACAWFGDAARATLLYDKLAPFASAGVVIGVQIASFGSADRPLGMLAATMQRWDDAEAHFEQAIAFDAASGGRPWLAHSRHEYAAMLLERKRAGDVQRASALLDGALSAARALGMRSLEQRVLALQQVAAGRDHYPAGLSAREVQVLQMVAEGKTNQEIASALFRSANTVANHVRNILAKIDAANRTEAAAFAVRHGLVKRP